jgi:hypothetical protein
MSFIPPFRPQFEEQLARSKDQERGRKLSDYSRIHPDGPVPNPRTHPMVRRLWRVLQGRHHGRGDSSGLG